MFYLKVIKPVSSERAYWKCTVFFLRIVNLFCWCESSLIPLEFAGARNSNVKTCKISWKGIAYVLRYYFWRCEFFVLLDSLFHQPKSQRTQINVGRVLWSYEYAALFKNRELQVMDQLLYDRHSWISESHSWLVDLIYEVEDKIIIETESM